MRCPHCDTSIDEHEASECLNEWIAVDVMGEEKPTIDHGRFHLEAIYSEGHNWYCAQEYDKGDVCIWRAKNFSGYIGVAWSVVEKMSDKGVGIDRFRDENNVLYWDVGFFMKPLAEADTAPLAICRAAIKATREELKNAS